MEKKGEKFLIITTKFGKKNLNNVDSLNIKPKVYQTTEKVRLYLIFIRNKIVSARVMY